MLCESGRRRSQNVGVQFYPKKLKLNFSKKIEFYFFKTRSTQLQKQQFVLSFDIMPLVQRFSGGKLLMVY